MERHFMGTCLILPKHTQPSLYHYAAIIQARSHESHSNVGLCDAVPYPYITMETAGSGGQLDSGFYSYHPSITSDTILGVPWQQMVSHVGSNNNIMPTLMPQFSLVFPRSVP